MKSTLIGYMSCLCKHVFTLKSSLAVCNGICSPRWQTSPKDGIRWLWSIFVCMLYVPAAPPHVVCLCVPTHDSSRCVSVSPCLWCVLLLHAVSTAFFVIVLTTNLQQDPIILQLPAPRALRGVPGKTTATPWWPRTSRAWPPPAGTPTTPRLTPTTPKQTPQRTPNSCHPLGNEASLFVMQ